MLFKHMRIRKQRRSFQARRQQKSGSRTPPRLKGGDFNTFLRRNDCRFCESKSDKSAEQQRL